MSVSAISIVGDRKKRTADAIFTSVGVAKDTI